MGLVDFSRFPRRSILCIDAKSFFASVEAVRRGLDPLEAYITVVSDLRRTGAVVLASSPKVKSEYNIKTGNRLFEIPRRSPIMVVEPNMALYIHMNQAIQNIFRRFVTDEDLHVYSIDESLLEEKGSDCTSPTVNEEVLQAAVVKAINELLASKDTFLSTLQANIETVLNEEHDKITNDIDVKLEELQNELLRLANSKTDYEEVAEEIYRLREQKQNALVENADREGKRQRIAEMSDFLNEQSCELEEYDEQLVRRLIEKVTVFDEKMNIEFKSGVEIEGRI